MNIYSVVDRKRFGLFNFSNDLERLLNPTNFHLIKKHNGEFGEQSNSLIFFLDILFASARGDKVLVWNIGPTFIFSLFFRLKGVQTIYTYHEPLSLKERIEKIDNFFLPLFNHLVTNIFLPLFTKIIVLKKSNIKNSFLYAPLPIKYNLIEPSKNYRPLTLLFLGGRIDSRAYKDFKRFTESKKFNESDFKSDIFPKKNATSESEKINIFKSKKVVIWNFFKIPYNQSGVTTDAIKYGIPLIVSNYEDLIKPSKEINNNPFIFVDSVDEINIDLLSKIDRDYHNYSQNMRHFFDTSYSETSQTKYWLKALQ
jgi:hypothetical protein